MKSFLVFLAVTFLLAGCQAQRTYLKPSLEEQGEVFLYLRPFPRESEPLKFTLSQINAIMEDGREFPLLPAFTECSREAVPRQRLFASGELPPGDYVALSVGVSGATMKDEEGEQRLLVPEKPVRIDFRFSVRKKKATLVLLAFRYDLSVNAGYGFSPAFSFSLPAKPITGLVGYVSNYRSNNLTVFDKQANEVVGVIATGAGPRGMAIDQQRRRAYVALAGDDAIEVLDITLGEIINRIRLKPGDSPQEMVLTPDGKTLLTINPGTNTVSVVDPLSLLEVARIPVGDAPTSIAINPTGTRAYVFNSNSISISVIDIASRLVAASAASEPGLSRGQFSRNGDVLYIIHELSSFLGPINPISLAPQQRFRVGMGLAAIKVDTMTNLIYTGRKYRTDIEVFEPNTFVAIANIRTSGGVAYLTIDGEQNRLYAVIGDKRTVSVSNLVTWEPVAEFDVGDGPSWVTLMGER